MIFSAEPSNGKYGPKVRSWCQHTWRICLSTFHETPHSSSPHSPMEIGNFHFRFAPNSISDDSKVEPSGLVHHFEGRSHSGHQPSGAQAHGTGGGRHCKQGAARKTALSHAPGHEDLSSSLSCKVHACSTIAVNHSQKPTNELRQLCPPKHMENPGMVDAGTCGGKIRQ